MGGRDRVENGSRDADSSRNGIIILWKSSEKPHFVVTLGPPLSTVVVCTTSAIHHY